MAREVAWTQLILEQSEGLVLHLLGTVTILRKAHTNLQGRKRVVKPSLEMVCVLSFCSCTLLLFAITGYNKKPAPPGPAAFAGRPGSPCGVQEEDSSLPVLRLPVL